MCRSQPEHQPAMAASGGREFLSHESCSSEPDTAENEWIKEIWERHDQQLLLHDINDRFPNCPRQFQSIAAADEEYLAMRRIRQLPLCHMENRKKWSAFAFVPEMNIPLKHATYNSNEE